jgi:hypothetical protein
LQGLFRPPRHEVTKAKPQAVSLTQRRKGAKGKPSAKKIILSKAKTKSYIFSLRFSFYFAPLR